MVTQFGFTPTVTTAEMRQNPDIIDKVQNINNLRKERQTEIEESGQELIYEFDYLLLCNKICGKSHYNMQMKIIVETQEEFDAWMAEQTTFAKSLN
jgi:cytochrome c oxidase subunit 2